MTVMMPDVIKNLETLYQQKHLEDAIMLWGIGKQTPGLPAIVSRFIKNKHFGGILKMQQILLDYEENITKYAGGLNQGEILNVYRKIPVFLGRDNKKFQILQHFRIFWHFC